MINYCFIVKNINGLERRISTIKMEHFRKSDTYSVYFNGKTVLAQDSEDLFGENSMSLAPQETIDLCANSLEVPTTDPQEGPNCKKLRLTCEDYLKDSTTSASAETSDEDITPDLDLATVFSNYKNDKNEHSKNHEEVKKSPCYNWTQTRELSNDCENFEHSLSVNIDSDECDVSVDSNTTYVDSLECNMKDCKFSHKSTYKKETDSDGYYTPSLETFRNSQVQITGNEIIQQMTFYAHKLRECEKKLIEEYEISPVTVKRWMKQL